MADDPVRLSREQRLQTLQNRHALRQVSRAGVPPIDDDVDLPTPAERIARLAARVGTQRPDVLPPRAPIRGEDEPAPPPALTPLSEGEAQLNDVTDRLHHEAARRGLVRLLAAPGAAQTATTVERILGANLPGAAGEHFSNIAGQHEEEERLARDEHPVAGAASDVGALYLQMEALGRIPGPIGRIFNEPAVGGAPATRGLFEGGKITGTLEQEGVGTVRDRLARAAMVEGRRFAALEGGTSLAERDPADVVAERAGLGFAGGAGFGVAGQGARELASTAIRAGLRGIARRNLPPMESPLVRQPELESGAPRALLAPPAEPAGAAGMPDHVVNAGLAQRLALELTGQSPDPQLPGQPVASSSTGQSVAPVPIGTGAIPLEPPPSIVPQTPYEPPRPKPIVLPEGAPEVLGGDATDVGHHAPKPGDVGTLPQPRRKNFKNYDDAALEARWTEISDRMEAMARQRDAGTTPWVRKEERSAGAGTSGGRGFGGYSREKGVLSGTAINASAGRAIGRMKDDTRILGELEREFHARGINPADVMDRYIERGHRLQAEQESGAERAALQNQDEGGGDTSFDVRERTKPYGGERIHAVALRLDNDEIVPGKPGQIHGELVPPVGHDAVEEGFVTSAGRFVGRKEAAVIAKAAAQLSKPGAVALGRRKSGELDAIDMPDSSGSGVREAQHPLYVREPHRPYKLPHQKGDKIVAPATLTHGRVYRGKFHHGEALENADRNLKRRGLLKPGQLGFIGEQGFIVRRPDGREEFTDREQALGIARLAGQVDEAAHDESQMDPELGAESINESLGDEVDRQERRGEKLPPIREEPQAYGVPAVREGGTLRAYHGSPYRFDRFSDAAIGTGQGAASYGHGHYFADLEEIGEGYRKQLTHGKDHNASISIDGKPLYRGNPMVGSHYIGDLGLSEEAQRGALEVHYEVQWIPKEKSAEALSIARKRIQDYVDTVPENIKLYEQRIAETRAEGREPAQLESDLRKIRQTLEAKRAALDLLDRHEVEYLPPERAGSTYTVELKADHDEMLDWDLPLTKQSVYVQNRLRNELHYELDRAKIKYPTLKQALHLFQSARVQRLAASDIGIRESLRNGLIYAERGDEDLFRRWFDHHGRLLSPGRVPALHRNGEDFYESLVSEMGIEEFNGRRDAMKRASAKLLRAGIKGIRYLDQGSRGKSRARRPYTGSTELLAAATDLKQNNYQFEDADDALTKAYPFASQPARIAALEEAYDVKPKLTYNYVVFSDRDIAITAVREMLKPSPWLDKQGKVSEADAAFGGEQQMELSLDKAVEQLQLKPEKPETPAARPKRAKGEPVIQAVAHYKKRAAAARKIVADLKKGQANWTGRQFPNVWPSTKSDDVGEWGNRGQAAKYDELVDGIGTMLQALRSPFVETLVMFGTREGQVVLSHVVTSGILTAASVEAKGGVDLSARFLEDALRAGATHVHTAHNHPSGRTDPSGLDGDIGMWGSLVSRADRMGLKPGINLIIDDETFSVSEFRKEPDGSGYSVSPKFVPYRYSPKVPWFAPAPGLEDRVIGPEDVAAVVHKLGKTKNGYLIHLNNASAIVGVEPFTPGDNVKPAVASAAERYGASGTIVGINDRALFVDFLDTYKTSSTLIRGVLDIVGAFSGERQFVSARQSGEIKINESIRLERQWLATITGRRIHEPGPMADPWRGQPGYVTDPVVLGARPIIVPRGLVVDGPRAVREGLGPAYGEDNLPNTASIIAQEAIDAAEKLGLAPAAEGTVEKLVTAFAGTRLEQIGGPLHLVLVEYERQRVELEQAVQKDIIRESLNRSAVEFMARLPYFNEFRAVSLLAWLRDKLPKAIGKSIGVTPDRQEALFNAAEAIAEFGPDDAPVFRDVLERTGQLDETGYQRLVEIYGHPAKLELEVEQLKKAAETIRHDLVRPSVTLSPANYAVERYKLSQRAKQEAKKDQAAQILSALKSERNAKKQELTELKGQRDLHAKEGILDDDAAAALPAEIERTQKELDSLRAQISRFEGLVAGRTPAGPAIDPKELPAKLKELDAKLAKWRELRGKAKETDEVLRARWSNLRAFREAYEARSQGRQAGEVRITADEAKRRWEALSPAEQGVVRRFALDAARAKEKGLVGHVNRELAKLEYEISSDIEAYVHHYGFEDEGAMTLWFGSTLRRKKMIAGARQHRGGVEGFKRHLEGARLHGGLPLSLQKLQNEFAEALERVMFTAPDPNLVRPLGADEDPPEGYSRVLGRFGEFKGQAYAVANPIYKELEFFGTRPPVHPTTDARANRAWELVKSGGSRAIYYWALNQLISVGTATRNLIGGAVQYATLVAEDLAKGDFYAAQKHLLALARALAPSNVRAFPVTEFGASQQTLRELDKAHGLFRAFMNTALIPFGMVENLFKRALTLSTRELEAQRIAKELLETGKIEKVQLDQVTTQLFDAPTFEMRASEELVRDAFAYNYNNIPLALKKMNKSAIGKAIIPFPIYGYKFARHVGRYTGAISRLARMKGRAGDLQKAIAAIIIFGLPVVLTWLGDDEGKAKTTDPGSGIKYDFDRSGRVYVGLNDEGRELWMRTNSYSFYGLGATIGHVAHDRSLIEAKNYLADFYSVGPGFQAADYLRQVRNRYQAYRNNASIAGDFARSWIPFHRPLETATRMVDPIRRKQESFTESMLYAIPIPEPVLNQFGLSRGEPRTAMGGAQLVPGYNPLLEFLKEFGGVNLKPIDPRQAQDEYRRAAIRTQARERRSHAESQRLRRLEQRQRERQ